MQQKVVPDRALCSPRVQPPWARAPLTLGTCGSGSHSTQRPRMAWSMHIRHPPPAVVGLQVWAAGAAVAGPCVGRGGPTHPVRTGPGAWEPGPVGMMGRWRRVWRMETTNVNTVGCEAGEAVAAAVVVVVGNGASTWKRRCDYRRVQCLSWK